MSSALCVCIHASETGHAEGVPISPSRGCSVEVPFRMELVTLNIKSQLGNIHPLSQTRLKPSPRLKCKSELFQLN